MAPSLKTSLQTRPKQIISLFDVYSREIKPLISALLKALVAKIAFYIKAFIKLLKPDFFKPSLIIQSAGLTQKARSRSENVNPLLIS